MTIDLYAERHDNAVEIHDKIREAGKVEPKSKCMRTGSATLPEVDETETLYH